jgi:hypothetical protein
MKMVIKQDNDGDIHGTSPEELRRVFVSVPKEEYLALYNIMLIAKGMLENRAPASPALAAAVTEYLEAKKPKV